MSDANVDLVLERAKERFPEARPSDLRRARPQPPGAPQTAQTAALSRLEGG